MVSRREVGHSTRWDADQRQGLGLMVKVSGPPSSGRSIKSGNEPTWFMSLGDFSGGIVVAARATAGSPVEGRGVRERKKFRLDHVKFEKPIRYCISRELSDTWICSWEVCSLQTGSKLLYFWALSHGLAHGRHSIHVWWMNLLNKYLWSSYPVPVTGSSGYCSEQNRQKFLFS